MQTGSTAKTISVVLSLLWGAFEPFSKLRKKKSAYKSRADHKLEGYSRFFSFFFSKIRKFSLLFSYSLLWWWEYCAFPVDYADSAFPKKPFIVLRKKLVRSLVEKAKSRNRQEGVWNKTSWKVMSYKEDYKGLLANFAAPAIGVTQRIRRIFRCRKGFANKSLLPTTTANVAGDGYFSSSTCRSTRDCPPMAYYLPPPVHLPQACFFLAGRYQP